MTTEPTTSPAADAPPPGAARDSMVNRVLAGRYELLEMLGEGPLLAAYRARDRVVNRLVTVKVILPAYADRPEIVADLKQGLSHTLALAHPNIARAFDVGTDEETGRVFLAEEYVRGIDLKERIRRVAPFQLTAATETAISIVEALEAAHARGIAHGDIRPQNILIGPDGQVKVTGFGAAVAQTRVVLADPNLLKRVVGYIAPDSARAAAPTASGDLYAVGCVLYEMLTGDVPFSGDTAVQVALKHAQDPVPAPRALNAGVPPALDGITQKALGKRPEDRYASASELLRDLRAVRDALKFGKPLNWSPMDGKPASAPLPATPMPPTAGGAPAATTPAAAAPASGFPAAGAGGLADATVPARNRAASTPPAVTTPSAAPTVVSSASLPTGADGSLAVMPGNAPARGKHALPADTYMDDELPPRPGGVGRWMTFINLLLAFIFIGVAAYIGLQALQYIKPTEEVVVPNLVGMKLEDAETMALEKKFKLEAVSKEFREKEAKDVIFQQNPSPGRRIKEGKPVGIWVSRGPRMVDVPDVKSINFAKARRIIESRGLKLGAVNYESDPLEPKGNVLRQAPLADANVPRGTKIDIWLSKGEEPTPGPEATPTDLPTADAAVPSPDATATPKPQERFFKVRYPVPTEGNREHRIRIDVFDDEGPRTIYDETMKAGAVLERQVRTVGKNVSIKVFDDDVLASELNKE